jgi:DNA polymerase-3 subunit alpha
MYKDFGALTLFADEWDDFTLPVLEEGQFDQAFDEIELLGFPLHPVFELLENPSRYAGSAYALAADLGHLAGRQVRMLGYYVCRKDVRTVRREMMCFGTWIDREGHFFDTTHFPNFLKNSPFRGKGIYLIEGRVATEFGFFSVEVTRMTMLPLVKDERYE